MDNKEITQIINQMQTENAQMKQEIESLKKKGTSRLASLIGGVLAFMVIGTVLIFAAIVKPNTFTAGTPISASNMNSNFDVLYHWASNIDSVVTVNNGKMGVGTINPNGILSIKQKDAGTTSPIKIEYFNSADNWSIEMDANKTLRFPSYNGSTKMSIDSTGNIGIGILPDSTNKLKVNGRINALKYGNLILDEYNVSSGVNYDSMTISGSSIGIVIIYASQGGVYHDTICYLLSSDWYEGTLALLGRANDITYISSVTVNSPTAGEIKIRVVLNANISDLKVIFIPVIS